MSGHMKVNPSLHELSSSSDPQKHEIAALMIENGVNVNGIDAEGNSLLHVAVKSEAFAIIEAILKLKKPVIFTDEYLFDSNKGPITMAMRSPNVVKMLTLFSKYRCFNFAKYSKLLPWDMPEDHFGKVTRTLLELTAQPKVFDLAKCIEEYRRLVTTRTKLFISRTTGENNEIINLRRVRNLREPSSSSDPQKHVIAALMIKNGIDVDGLDPEENTLLQVAVKNEAFAVIEAIVNVNPAILTDEYLFDSNQSPMTLTMRCPNAVKILTLFFENRSLDFAKCCKLLPWDMPEDHLGEVVRTLLQLTRKIKEPDILRWIVHFVSKNRKLTKLIINCTTRSDNRMVSLQKLLVNVSSPVIMALLISEGAKINDHVNDEQQYPLHLACQTSVGETARLLLHLGADVNVTDRFGNTPFSMSLEDDREFQRDDNSPTRYMIQHFACLNVTSKKVNDKDLSFIRGTTHLQRFYNSCIQELSRMKTIEAADGFPYYWFFSKTSYQLSLFLRDSNVCKQMKKSILRLGSGVFPIYWTEIIVKFGLAKKISNLVVSREREVEEVFGEIFPYLVICKITKYLLDLKKFTKQYYLNKLLEM